MNCELLLRFAVAALSFVFLRYATGQGVQPAILAGDEAALPGDSPLIRIDSLGTASPFDFVGALNIQMGGFSYKGTGAALSPHWVLTAGHNLDLNDNGEPDAGLSVSLSLPGFGSFIASDFYTHPGFSGFGNSSVQRDLGLLYFKDPLPAGLNFLTFDANLRLNDQITLVGFGRSGYGNYGYTTEANLADRRIGFNVVDSFSEDDLGGNFSALLRYDFDAPDTFGKPVGSLGNSVESIIGPGDSGGPILVNTGSGWAIAGVSTFTEGFGGRFGDIGGGVVLAPYLDWIGQTTGIAVPEPPSNALLLAAAVSLWLMRRRNEDPSRQPTRMGEGVSFAARPPLATFPAMTA